MPAQLPLEKKANPPRRGCPGVTRKTLDRAPRSRSDRPSPCACLVRGASLPSSTALQSIRRRRAFNVLLGDSASEVCWMFEIPTPFGYRTLIECVSTLIVTWTMYDVVRIDRPWSCANTDMRAVNGNMQHGVKARASHACVASADCSVLARRIATSSFAERDFTQTRTCSPSAGEHLCMRRDRMVLPCDRVNGALSGRLDRQAGRCSSDPSSTLMKCHCSMCRCYAGVSLQIKT